MFRKITVLVFMTFNNFVSIKKKKKKPAFFKEYHVVRSALTCNGNLRLLEDKEREESESTIDDHQTIYINIFLFSFSLDLKMQETCVCSFEMLVLPTRPHGITNQETTAA